MAWYDRFKGSSNLPHELQDAFERASRALREQKLPEAANSLCRALTALSKDDMFWDAAIEHAAEPSKYQAFADLADFLNREREPLTRLFGKSQPRTVEDLLSEITPFLEAVEKSPKPDAKRIQDLRQQVSELAAEICKAAGSSKDLLARTRLLRIVKKGLVVVAGAAVVLGDGYAVAHGVPLELCVYSAEVGIKIIETQFRRGD